MIEHDELNFTSFGYQSGLGDIDFGKQLINLEATDKVVLRKAHIFRFLETVTLSIGRFDGRGFYPVRKTNGVAVSTTGLSKYLSANFDNDVIQFISKHISIEYYNSTLFKDWWGETDIEGVGIILKNFSF